jgi:hypothetical protein
MMIDFDNGDRNGLLRRSRRVIGLATTSFELLWTPAVRYWCYWPRHSCLCYRSRFTTFFNYLIRAADTGALCYVARFFMGLYGMS